MPIPHEIARVNRSVTNRVTQLFAGKVPGFAIIIHAGRVSGKEYRTPLNAFATDDGFAIALTYGSSTDWVKNVVAARGCSIEYRRHTIHLTDPHFSTIADQSDTFPAVVRFILGVINVENVLLLRRASSS
jgi:deazaflavin-dependent oxidoreductase (nitroreductase family)